MYLYDYDGDDIVISFVSITYADWNTLEEINKILHNSDFQENVFISLDDLETYPRIKEYLKETRIKALEEKAIQYVIIRIN